MRLPRVRLSTLILMTIVAGLSLTLVVQRQRTGAPPTPRGGPPPAPTIPSSLWISQAIKRRNELDSVIAKERAAKAVKNRAIDSALDGRLELPPPSGATLRRFFHHITSVTYTEELTNGIPIEVDPIGLREAGVSLTTPLTPSSGGVSVREALSEQLDRLGLDYVVKGGVLTVTSKESADKPLNRSPN